MVKNMILILIISFSCLTLFFLKKTKMIAFLNSKYSQSFLIITFGLLAQILCQVIINCFIDETIPVWWILPMQQLWNENNIV